MLKIYYGRETINKSKFIFENIEGKTLLIVPDQYTLEAEKDAFFYLKKKAIIDLDVMSFSRLGELIVKKAGRRPDVLTREGRQMIITKILRENEENLEIFRGSAKKIEFVTMIHDLIADFKQHNTSLEDLKVIESQLEDDIILKKKLKDIILIFEKYEEYAEGKFIDTEEYISFYTNLMDKVEFLQDRQVWIYGFDSFTDKNISIISKINECARQTNVVLTYDYGTNDSDTFAISKYTISKLKKAVGQLEEIKIGSEYKIQLPEDLAAIEQNLFAIPQKKIKESKNVILQRTLNPYNDAVNAAMFILKLVREKGYRYKDIAVISNDIENSGKLYQRVFAEYGIDLYIDIKRNITHHPAVNYIYALMDVIRHGYLKEDVIRMIKSGFVCSDFDVEFIEMYANVFNIKGSQWKNTFTKLGKYSEEDLVKLNNIREFIINPVEKFQKKFGKAKTTSEKVDELLEFLSEDMQLEEKLFQLASEQEKDNHLDLAQESDQIWEAITHILEQMYDGLGEGKVTNDEFVEILKSGIEAVEIGLVPPSVDSLVMGTMQRTRRRYAKVTMVLTANDGILPQENEESEILSPDERVFLNDNDLHICKISRIQNMEQTMAIYRNICKTEELLYMSYPSSGNTGEVASPSTIFTSIANILEDIKIQNDKYDQGEFENLLGGIEATKNNMISALMNLVKTGEIDKRWIDVYRYFDESEDMQKIVDAITSKVINDPITKEQAQLLYKRALEDDFVLSPSRLEKFGRCQFAHFINYGLKPDENREYKIGPAEQGTIYHECIMEFSRELSAEIGEDVPVYLSKWRELTHEDVRTRVQNILKRISTEYMEGIMSQGEYEKYKAERIERVCYDSILFLINQIDKAIIKDMKFECEFGREKDFPPLTLPTENGQVIIEGKIDRWDKLDCDYVRVVDYKSGNDKYSEAEARAGVKLQLFIYLLASSDYVKNRPGGAFYFPIDEANVKNEEPQKIVDTLVKNYKLSGFFINDESFVDTVDSEADKRSSQVMTYGEGKLDPDDFFALLYDMTTKIETMANDLTCGSINMDPKFKKNSVDSCAYCPYKGICKFDISVEGCDYSMI